MEFSTSNMSKRRDWRRCVVAGCNDNSRKKKYFGFPRDSQGIRIWLNILDLDLSTTAQSKIKSLYVCENHFTMEMLSPSRNRLTSTALPNKAITNPSKATDFLYFLEAVNREFEESRQSDGERTQETQSSCNEDQSTDTNIEFQSDMDMDDDDSGPCRDSYLRRGQLSRSTQTKMMLIPENLRNYKLLSRIKTLERRIRRKDKVIMKLLRARHDKENIRKSGQ